MAWRLSEHIASGEIDNLDRHSVHGCLRLRDRDQTLILALTGNCDADLAGKRFRFRAKPRRRDDEISPIDLDALHPQQVGPPGTMTAARRVKVFDCSLREFLTRSKLGEPPPTRWVSCLYLEWYSQNGNVVIELPEAEIEVLESRRFADAPADEPQAQAEGTSDCQLKLWDTDAPDAADHGQTDADDDDAWLAEAFDEDDDEAEDPYGLLPDALKRQFDADAWKTDAALDRGEVRGTDDEADHSDFDDYDAPDLYDDGLPLADLLDLPGDLPAPHELRDEAQAEAALKIVLQAMAVHGIQYRMCEHLTARAAYRALIEHILPEERANPGSHASRWVQCFDASEFCPICDARFMAELNDAMDRSRPTRGDDDETDIPF